MMNHRSWICRFARMREQMKRTLTKLIRTPEERTSCREHTEAMYLTSSFTFTNAGQAAEKFAMPVSEYVYSRFSNPNVKTLNTRIAALEDAPAALSVSSGMSAILSIIMGVCERGSRIVCGGDVFGATVQLLSNIVSKFDVRVDYVFGGEEEWEKALQEPATLLILETPSNPMLGVIDIEKVSGMAHKQGALLAVDNCFCPYGQKPLSLGADIVVHSATKYLDGQGRVLGGAIAGSEELLYEKIYPFLRSGGPALSPFNAWMISRGMETLPVRMRAHCESAKILSEWLEEQPGVEKVLHTGLRTHPGHELAMRQQNGLGGGIVTLVLRGGRKEAWRFIDGLKLFSITANFGDVKSTITHPATTTHSRLSDEHRRAVGIGENLVRLSIGLEDVEDLREDMSGGFHAIMTA